MFTGKSVKITGYLARAVFTDFLSGIDKKNAIPEISFTHWLLELEMIK